MCTYKLAILLWVPLLLLLEMASLKALGGVLDRELEALLGCKMAWMLELASSEEALDWTLELALSGVLLDWMSVLMSSVEASGWESELVSGPVFQSWLV